MHFRKVSVARIVAIALVATITVLLAAVGAGNYLLARERQLTALREDVVVTADQLAVALAVSLWNLDKEQVARIMESTMQQRTVSGLALTAAGISVFMTRNAQWEIETVSRELPQPGALREERPILHQDREIGRVRVQVTARFVEAELRRTLIMSAVVVGLLDLALVLGLYFLLWRLVLGPLGSISRYAVAVSGGGRADPPQAGRSFRGELEELRFSTREMVALLESRYAEARAAEEKYRDIFESAVEGIFQTTADGHFITANPALSQMLGYESPEEMTRLLDDIPGQLYTDPERRRELRRQVEEQGTVTRFELQARRKDGRSIWLALSGRGVRGPEGELLRLEGSAEDITDLKITELDRRRVEREVKHLKDYLANIIDSMPALLAGMDAQGRVTQWNRRAEAATGVAEPQALGRPLLSLLSDFSPWIEALQAEVAAGRPAGMQKVLKVKDGERRFYDLMLFPLATNGVEGTVVRIEDVTEKTRVQEMMIQTEKMMSIGGLAAGMAHEINNPLGIISQAIQNIERRVSPDLPANRAAAGELGVEMERVRAYFEKREIPVFVRDIRDASDRAARIVTNMLQFSRGSAGAMEDTQLEAIVEQTIALAANDYDLKKRFDFRSIEIVREFDPGLPPVPLRRVEIEQVLLNLVKNAAQALADNPPERRPRICIRLRRDQRYAVLEVQDNGPGMEQEISRRVFEPFFTTKDPGVGTGLGLSVSYTIVTQNHRGLIDLETSPGNGARFIVSLPLKEEP